MNANHSKKRVLTPVVGKIGMNCTLTRSGGYKTRKTPAGVLQERGRDGFQSVMVTSTAFVPTEAGWRVFSTSRADRTGLLREMELNELRKERWFPEARGVMVIVFVPPRIKALGDDIDRITPNFTVCVACVRLPSCAMAVENAISKRTTSP